MRDNDDPYSEMEMENLLRKLKFYWVNPNAITYWLYPIIDNPCKISKKPERVKEKYFRLGTVKSKMYRKLINYPVFEEVGEFLDTIPPSLRKKSVVEYKKFLHLKFLMKDTSCPAILSPSGLIDKVWHTHLLMPNNYAKFCQSVFGQSIDHDLAGSKSPENEKSKRWVSLISPKIELNFGTS